WKFGVKRKARKPLEVTPRRLQISWFTSPTTMLIRRTSVPVAQRYLSTYDHPSVSESCRNARARRYSYFLLKCKQQGAERRQEIKESLSTRRLVQIPKGGIYSLGFLSTSSTSHESD